MCYLYFFLHLIFQITLSTIKKKKIADFEFRNINANFKDSI
jgi:hypothetical protein